MDTAQGPSPAANPADWMAALELLPDVLSAPGGRQTDWLQLHVERQSVRDILHRLLEQRAALEGANFLGQTAGRGFQDDGVIAPGELVCGADIGRYRLMDVLGRGGMSVVWRAEQQDEAFSRVVALKFPRHAGASLARRLQREKRILAALEHASIARLYDVGVTPMGLPFIAMEYVAGEPLDTWCRERSAPLAARLSLLAQVFEAVQHAHAQLVLHRDIKPSNILVDEAGAVRLLDFGIAKPLHTESLQSAATELTQDMGAPMTPAYASPEQLRGEPLSVRSDVYALGVLMYELLTGTLPFASRSHVARGSALEGDLPMLPSRRAQQQTQDLTAQAFARSLRGDLDGIVLKALHPRSAKRYNSAAELHEDLLRHLRSEPVTAVPYRRSYVLGRFMRRHRVMVASLGLSAAALCTGTAVALTQAARAADEAARARAVSAFLIDVFQASSIDTVDAGMARRQTAQELLTQGARRLVAGSLEHGPSRRELQRVLSLLLDDLAMTDEAMAVRQQWLKELQDERAAPGTTAEVLLAMARTRSRQGDPAHAAELLSQVQQLLTVAPGRPTQSLAQEARIAEGQLALRNGDTAAALKAVAELSRAAPGTPLAAPAHAAWLELQAGVANVEGRTDAAAALLAETVALHEKTYASSPARLAIALYAVSNHFWEIGRADDTWLLLNRAHGLAEAALGPDHISTVLMNQQRGRLLVYRGDLPGGLQQLRHSAEQLSRFSGRIEPTALVRAKDYLVEALLANGRYREALQALDEAQALIKATAELPFDASQYHDILRGRVYNEVGRYPEALGILREAAQAIEQRLGSEGPAWLDVQTRILDTLRASGAGREAWELLETLEQRCAADAGLQAQFGSELKMTRVAMLLDKGDAREALQIMRSATAERQPTAWQQADVATRWRHGRLSLQLGQPEEAEQAFRSVVKDLSSHGYAFDPSIAQARGYLAQALQATGRAQEARQEAARAREALRRELAGRHFARPLQRLSAEHQRLVVMHH